MNSFFCNGLNRDIVSVNPGDAVNLTVATAGFPQVFHQWSKDERIVSGASEATFRILNATNDNTGTYVVQACNVLGCRSSNVFHVRLNQPPTLLTKLNNLTVAIGNSAQWPLRVAGIPFPTVQWFRKGETTPISTSLTLFISSVVSEDTGFYYAIIRNTLNTIVTGEYFLRVVELPKILYLSESRSIVQGITTHLSVQTEFQLVPSSYQWLVSHILLEIV